MPSEKPSKRKNSSDYASIGKVLGTYPGGGWDFTVKDGVLTVSRTISVSLPLDIGPGAATHRCARALAAARPGKP